jgi:hypothetical protein
MTNVRRPMPVTGADSNSHNNRSTGSNHPGPIRDLSRCCCKQKTTKLKSPHRRRCQDLALLVIQQIMKIRTVLCLLGLSLAIATIRNLVQVASTSSVGKKVVSDSTSDGRAGNDWQYQTNHPTIVNQSATIVGIPGGTAGISTTSLTTVNTPPRAKTTTTTTISQTDSTAEKTAATTTIFYSHGRSDRSGSAIQDMLMSHAFCFHYNLTYGGACADWTLPQFQGKRLLHMNLLHAVGLDKTLPLLEHCPPNLLPSFNESMTSIVRLARENKRTTTQSPHQSPIRRTLSRGWYIANDTLTFSPDYLDHIHRLVEYPVPRNNKDILTIAVHIRRGDIGPCRARTRGYHRYLPNSHFVRLIDLYSNSSNNKSDTTTGHAPSKPPPPHVVIYSESESFESFDVFRQRGYEVVLDGDIGNVWKGLIAADIVILSRSSFSLVPAVLSQGKVVYTPFWHDPLPHWDIVEEAFLNTTLQEFKDLKQVHCPKRKKQKNQPARGGEKEDDEEAKG